MAGTPLRHAQSPPKVDFVEVFLVYQNTDILFYFLFYQLMGGV